MTPAIASEPYCAAAPSRRISMFCRAGAGMAFEVMAAIALSLGLHDAPVVGLDAEVAALLAKLAEPGGLRIVAGVLAGVAAAATAFYLSGSVGALLATTNAAESLLSRTRHVKRNVKRWRGGQMMLRWVAAGVLEAVKGFRRLKGHADMPRLVAGLRARDQRIGLGASAENVA